MNRHLKIAGYTTTLAASFITIAGITGNAVLFPEKPLRTQDYSFFLMQAENGRVLKATVREDRVVATDLDYPSYYAPIPPGTDIWKDIDGLHLNTDPENKPGSLGAAWLQVKDAPWSSILIILSMGGALLGGYGLLRETSAPPPLGEEKHAALYRAACGIVAAQGLEKNPNDLQALKASVMILLAGRVAERIYFPQIYDAEHISPQGKEDNDLAQSLVALYLAKNNKIKTENEKFSAALQEKIIMDAEKRLSVLLSTPENRKALYYLVHLMNNDEHAGPDWEKETIDECLRRLSSLPDIEASLA